jgi:WD40 repeat protein
VTDVFISYSRRESESFASRLTDRLEQAGVDVWVDLEDIPAASEWERDLGEGVLASEYVCFLISPGAVSSPHCLNELEHAEAHHKRLLPVVHKPVPDDQVPDSVRRLNWIPQRGAFEDDFEASLAVLVAAIQTDLEDLREHTRWEERAREWDGRDRDPSLLCRGAVMRQAEDWLAHQAEREPPPTTLQIEYINASRRASARRQGGMLAGAVLALVVAVALGALALLQRNEARDQRDLARSNELAAAAIANLGVDPERSLILATAAARTRPTDRSEQALAQAISASSLRARIELQGKPYQARVSADDRWMASGTARGAALYDTETGDLVRSLYDGGAIYDLVFDPDSSGVWVAGEDGDIRHYSVPEGELEDTIPMPDATSSIAVSARSILIAATTTAGEVRVFDSGGDLFQTLKGHEGSVITVDFADHGPGLISASTDGTVRVWDAITGEQIGELEGMSGRYRDADLTADGQTAVTVDFRGVVRVWDVDSGITRGDQLNDLTREGRARSVDLSADESSVLVSFGDGRARLSNLDDRQVAQTFGRHNGAVRSAEFGGAGRSVVTTGLSDGEARIYDAGTLLRTFPDSGYAYATAVDPHDRLVAVAGTDGSLGVYDRASGATEASWAASQQRLRAVQFDHSGERLVTGGDDGVARIWDVDSGEQVGPSLPHDDAVTGVAFDPTGERLATASFDGAARIWDLASGEANLLASGDYTTAIDWSPDGELIAVATQRFRTHTIHVIDPETREDVTPPFENPGGVASLGFDPAGDRIVVGSGEGTARIFEARTGKELVVLSGQIGAVNSAEFTLDGRRVITTGPEGTRVWSAESGLPLDTFPGYSVFATPSASGAVVIAYQAVRPAELHDCEACNASPDELLSLAEERITREPTPAEIEEFGLD